jgi:hypothetical protein
MSLGKSLLNNTVYISINGLSDTFLSLKNRDLGEVFLGLSLSLSL